MTCQDCGGVGSKFFFCHSSNGTGNFGATHCPHCAMTGWAKENWSPCYGIGSVDCKTCHRLGKCQIVVEPVMMALEVAAQKLQTALHASLD